jgi:hypothetical protein
MQQSTFVPCHRSRSIQVLRSVSLLLIVLSLAAGSANAQGQRFESGAGRVQLVELFTSEGCSSCPPADRWLSKLKQHDGLFRDFVPFAFHVDYWNYIGWPDRFASATFSERQREYARSGNIGTVYTPGFVVAGREWRGWFRRPVLENRQAVLIGNLTLDVTGTRYVARVEPRVQLEHPKLEIALLGFGLRTQVKAGENAGRMLAHDFVVLAHRRKNLERDGSAWTVSGMLPSSNVIAGRYAVAAWMTASSNPAPLQAVGGYLR